MFRLLTYNIQRGGHGRLDAIAEVIGGCAPDLVLLQEATDRGNVERLAAATGMADWRTSGTQSLGFLSRRPVAHCEWVRPGSHGTPSSRWCLTVNSTGVRRPSQCRARGVDRTAAGAGTARAAAQHQRHQHSFHVLTGDFNTVVPGETLDIGRLPMRIRPLVWLSGGRINWRTIELVLGAGYVDAFRLHHPGEPGATLPASNPYLRLDYVFAPQQHAGRVLDCRVVRGLAAETASNHLPVVADLALDGPDVAVSGPGTRTPR